MSHFTSQNQSFDEDFKDDFELIDRKQNLRPDDLHPFTETARHLERVLEGMTRIGGEVQRLRSEVDILLSQNGALLDSFFKLKSVLDEKGILDTNDFDLACDVLEEISGKTLLSGLKKLPN